MNTSRSTDRDGPRQVDLYAAQASIHVRNIHGRFSNLRRWIRWVGLVVLFLAPWLTWGGRQAILLDLPARQFHFFGVTFFPQDFVLVAWLLIIGAFALFTFTNWLGRVWCGYVCPQSVWFTLFMGIEEFVEGSRTKRMRLEEHPWDAEKLRLRATKWALWGLLALATALSIVGLFAGIRELLAGLVTFSLAGWTLFWLGFFTVVTYVFGAVLREQVCLYMCPYARFQSAMFDPDTLIVSYDQARGEPRGSRSRKTDPTELGLGDCVDCELCVQVCPTGIDIREGLQYECISCAHCIDACDSIMDKMGYARGLIRYTTEHALEGRPSRVLRPRLIGYAAVLAVMVTAFGIAATARVPFELEAIRDRQSLFAEVQTDAGPRVENVYTLRIVNMSQQERVVRIDARGLEDPDLLGAEGTVTLAAGEVRSLPVRLRARAPAQANTEIAFDLVDARDGSVILTEESRFLAPAGGRS
jgi:cytochrome c oxidase accessory protein FixG